MFSFYFAEHYSMFNQKLFVVYFFNFWRLMVFLCIENRMSEVQVREKCTLFITVRLIFRFLPWQYLGLLISLQIFFLTTTVLLREKDVSLSWFQSH